MVRSRHHLKVRGVGFGALAIGATALGAFTVGALSVGAFAIGALAVGRARFNCVEIDELVVGRIVRKES